MYDQISHMTDKITLTSHFNGTELLHQAQFKTGKIISKLFCTGYWVMLTEIT